MLSATRLFVGNLPETTEEQELYSAFSNFGQIANLDLKLKAAPESKKFAFISLSASNVEVESCISYFSNRDFKGTRLYVTRARESFLERLQRERDEEQKKKSDKGHSKRHLLKKSNMVKACEKVTLKKRKLEHTEDEVSNKSKKHHKTIEDDVKVDNTRIPTIYTVTTNKINIELQPDKKKEEAERKRVDSMKKKRQEFKEKQMIIKTNLTGVDKVRNKKIVFADEVDHELVMGDNNKSKPNKALFDDIDNSDEELSFAVKKQFEGKKGQKVLDLQSRYKSDKRFTLDERFVDEEEGGSEKEIANEEVEIGQADEKTKQLNILQDVLGVTLKTRGTDNESKKNKPKIGMLRFDPMQPDHAKFLAPVETKPIATKKSKKNKKKEKDEANDTQIENEVVKVEVSKEQFYKVSTTLKEAIAQPNTFSLRSLFGNSEDVKEGPRQQDTDYIPLETPKEKKKVKNPFDTTEKNPFVYDSSDSEADEPEKETIENPPPSEIKAIWKENLFFSESDTRLKEGLSFFNKTINNEVQKDRRELKSLVKKRMYNNDRKNQMFKKKIGGRKKSMKKPNKNKH